MNVWPWAAGSGRPDPDETLELATFDPNARGTWRWTQPGRFVARWRLEVDGRLVAAMRGEGAFGRAIVVRFADATWDVRTHFPHALRLTRRGESTPHARFQPGWWSGGRVLREGRDALLWRREGFWGMRWALRSPEQLPWLHLIVQRDFLRRGCVVELEDAARRDPDLAMLLALAWVLVLQAHRGHASRH